MLPEGFFTHLGILPLGLQKQSAKNKETSLPKNAFEGHGACA
jgi:hypothetical protein